MWLALWVGCGAPIDRTSTPTPGDAVPAEPVPTEPLPADSTTPTETGSPAGPGCMAVGSAPVVYLPDESGDGAGAFLEVADVDGDGCDELLVEAATSDVNVPYGSDAYARGSAHLLGAPFAGGALHAVARTSWVRSDWSQFWAVSPKLVTATDQVVFWGFTEVAGSERDAAMTLSPIAPGSVTEADVSTAFRDDYSVWWPSATPAECVVDGGPGLCLPIRGTSPGPGAQSGGFHALALPLDPEVNAGREAWATISGEGSDGATVLTGGADLDGDAVDDLLVGAPIRGQVAALYALPAGAGDLWTLANATYVGSAAATFGLHVRSADLDGNGDPEVFVGAPNAAPGGELSVFEGGEQGVVLAADARWTVVGDANGMVGVSSAVGDLDGDGVPDLAVGVKTRGAGRVAVFLAPAPGLLRTADADLVLVGDTVGDEFGAALAFGRFDGDTLADLAVGAPGDRQLAPRAGAVTIVFGAGL
jgi:hypothetical protein